MIQTLKKMPRNLWLALFVLLLITLIARLYLLASNTVSFHSDEAVVALMARHINQGERPIFFYGQAYMGSLDAWLVALGFQLFGESVTSIRIVQSVLYGVVVALTFGFAYRLTQNTVASFIAGLTLAVPSVLVALYTTATLGGYNETLILGVIVLWTGINLIEQGRSGTITARWWIQWCIFGFASGVGWWANGLIAIFIAPVALWQLIALVRGEGISRWTWIAGIGLALVAFVIGGLPWWLFNLEHDFQALQFFFGGNTEFAGTDLYNLTVSTRLIGAFLIGLPSLFGIRFPWSAEFFMLPLGLIVLVLYGMAIYVTLRKRAVLQGAGRHVLLSMIGIFFIIFLGSRFSSDPSGRYFLPLLIPCAVIFGAWVAYVGQKRRLLLWALPAVVVAYYGLGQVSAIAQTPPGMTTQFNLVTHIPNDDDADLIAFLEANQLTRGISNYWITFRLAFLSGERLIYTADFPEKDNLTYTPHFNRFLPYVEAVQNAPEIAYITANLPEVERQIELMLADAGINYQREQVGVYAVYYGFDPMEEAPRPPYAWVIGAE